MKNTTVVKESEQEKNAAVSVKHENHPSYPFHLLQRDMNHLFENFARGVDMWRPRFVEPLFGDIQIRLDLKDNDENIVFTAEIPGVEQKDIEISVTDDTLMVKGEKKEEKHESEKGYYRAERSYGCFQRMIPLPCEIEKDHVEATFNNGVLKIVLPKNKQVMKETKKVTIKSV